MKIPITYLGMMIAAGLTIGAITGLSNTSVSGALIELVVTFVAGSAGIYFISRDTIRKEANSLRIIGWVGLAFLSSFWIAYIPTTFFRYGGQALAHLPVHQRWKRRRARSGNQRPESDRRPEQRVAFQRRSVRE